MDKKETQSKAAWLVYPIGFLLGVIIPTDGCEPDIKLRYIHETIPSTTVLLATSTDRIMTLPTTIDIQNE